MEDAGREKVEAAGFFFKGKTEALGCPRAISGGKDA